MKRVVVAELLDSDNGTPREVADSFADLRMFNRSFGGVSTMTALLREVAAARGLKEIHWLDVAGGTGEVVTQASERLRRSGLIVRPLVMDRAVSHLNGDQQNVCGDALKLPFRESSFDVVGSSLFVHHLEPDEVVAFAREALRVARHAFAFHDLIRHPMHLALALVGRPIYRSRITRHDAPASVRRAYTVDEICRILADAGLANVTTHSFYLFRMGVIVWKHAEPSTT